jgi:4'-phosphopantetheinyl transferase
VELLEPGDGPLPVEGLSDGELHLWVVVPNPSADPGPLERLLPPDELARCLAAGSGRRRRELLLSRALVRSALSAYAPIPPSAWRFRTGRHGRPELDAPSPLRFNLSNCEGLVACVVAREREVGLDVEPASRAAAVLELAPRFTSPAERQALAALASPGARRDRALRLWTLKEAYLKARGRGLSLELRHLTFTFGATGIGLQAPPDLEPAPDRWAFASLEVMAHRAAVAAGQGPAPTTRLRLWSPGPLGAPGPGATATAG